MLKLIGRLLLFVPVLAGMMFVSWRVDPSGLFWGAGFERLASEYMLQGVYIDGYERLDGRALNEVYAKNVPQAPQILVNGSSRSMMIDTSFTTGEKTFYNASNVGADIYDFFNSYYIFEKENKTPEIFVMGIDAWLFNDGEENLDKRSNKEMYYEFLGEELGYENLEYEKPNPLEKYKALVDPSYFQGSVAYYFKDKSTEVQPEPVDIEKIYDQSEVIKAPDGSVIYDKKFRTRGQEHADHDAHTAANAIPILRLGDYDVLSPTYTEQFEKLDVNAFVTSYAEKYPEQLIERPEITVELYPEKGAERIVQINFNYQTDPIVMHQKRSKIEEAFRDAQLCTENFDDPADISEQLYLYLMGRAEYKATSGMMPAYDILVNGFGNSNDFAVVYARMCNRAGLDCSVVSGTKDGKSWSWNAISYRGKEYYVDVLQCYELQEFQLCKSDQLIGYAWEN